MGTVCDVDTGVVEDMGYAYIIVPPVVWAIKVY
jgi:hypothetical protein